MLHKVGFISIAMRPKIDVTKSLLIFWSEENTLSMYTIKK